VHLNDNGVSRNHATIEFRDGEWWVVDHGSTNGTFVNGRMVKERLLADGDRISIGGSELQFNQPNQER